jgi:outer membrane lipoprotein SlyB
METLIGIFRSPASAEAALQDLLSNNISQNQFTLLTRETLSTTNLTEITSTLEPPGACGANSGQVGGAIAGFAGGILSGALVSLMVPGLGPLIAVGALAFGGGLGAVAGGVVGNAVQIAAESIFPLEEHFIYEEALRQGAQVLIIQPSDDEFMEVARRILATHGAENATQARERWWQQLRANEASAYTDASEPFSMIEAQYRQGFEAALDARLRAKTHEEEEDFLTQSHSAVMQNEAFRRGFTRGKAYYEALVERGDPRRSTAFAAMDVTPSNS